MAVDFAPDHVHEAAKRPQESERLVRIAAAPDDKSRQVLLRFGVRHFGNEKRSLLSMRFDDLAHPSAQDRTDEDIGINDERLTRHCASSRALPGGFPCTPPS